MKVCKVFVPFGAVGSGIEKEAFDNGIAMCPDAIASDAGSTDSGPYYLGTGRGKYAREAVKEDLRLMLKGGRKLGVPVLVGSCGTCGSDQGVDEAAAICSEICKEEGFDLKIAKIYTQQDNGELKRRYLNGDVIPLQAAPDIDEGTFDRCSHIVAAAGAEPFIQAIKDGADVVLCGRATDTAIIAAYPIMMGCDVASCWHGAKIAECGPLCAADPRGGIFLTFDEEGVTVEPTATGNRCTVYSTSAHMLYENADPIHLTEPGVVIDLSSATYVQVNERQVRLSGAKAESMPYTLKLEGAAPAGFQTVSLVGIADRRIMANPMAWIGKLKSAAQARLEKVGLTEGYSYCLKPYGFNAVIDGEIAPGSYVPREIGLILLVTARTQALATKVAKVFNPLLLHLSVKENKQMPSFAFPFSPTEIEKGQTYEFCFYHAVKVTDPLELIRIQYEDLTQEVTV